MKMNLIKGNRWMKGLTKEEVVNWVQAMLEVGRYKIGGYWETQKLVSDPYGKPLAWAG